jgi:hypothetical protein
LSWTYLAHVGVLAVIALMGVAVTSRRINHLLLR